MSTMGGGPRRTQPPDFEAREEPTLLISLWFSHVPWKTGMDWKPLRTTKKEKALLCMMLIVLSTVSLVSEFIAMNEVIYLHAYWYNWLPSLPFSSAKDAIRNHEWLAFVLWMGTERERERLQQGDRGAERSKESSQQRKRSRSYHALPVLALLHICFISHLIPSQYAALGFIVVVVVVSFWNFVLAPMRSLPFCSYGAKGPTNKPSNGPR